MATMNIYANGETAGSSFYIASEWTCVMDPNGVVKLQSGPTLGAATFSYTLPDLPVGTRINNVSVHAIIGKRFMPATGIAIGYPQANKIKFEESDEESGLYIADIQGFQDATTTTKVTYTFKAASNRKVGKSVNSLSFDDVYLILDYTLPESDWSMNMTDDSVTISIVGTEDNSDYYHRVLVECANNTVIDRLLLPGEHDYTFSIDPSWMNYFPTGNTGYGTVIVQTLDNNQELLGTSEPVEFSFHSSTPLLPEPGMLEIHEAQNMFGT